jgi:hypothetical protein
VTNFPNLGNNSLIRKIHTVNRLTETSGRYKILRINQLLLDCDELRLANLCYTDNMQPNHPYWPKWVRLLQQWRMDQMAAFFLDAGGPVVILAAQAIYLGMPFFKESLPNDQLQAFAQLLEDQGQAKEFATFLREENPS